MCKGKLPPRVVQCLDEGVLKGPTEGALLRAVVPVIGQVLADRIHEQMIGR